MGAIVDAAVLITTVEVASIGAVTEAVIEETLNAMINSKPKIPRYVFATLLFALLRKRVLFLLIFHLFCAGFAAFCYHFVND